MNGLKWLAILAVSLIGMPFIATAQASIPIYQNTAETKQANHINAQRSEAEQLLHQGIQQYQTSQFQAALESWQQALEIYRAIGDLQREADSLGNLGLAYDSLSDYQRAIEFHQQSLAIAQQIGDRQGEASSLGRLGNVYRSLGQYQRAIDFLEQSLAIAREIGDRQEEANSLGNLGNVHASFHQYLIAINFLEQSLEIKQELDDHQGESDILNNLGIIYRSLGQYQLSIEFLKQSLEIKQEFGDRHGEAASFYNLGITYRLLGQYEQATSFLQQSLEIAREIGSRQIEASSLGSLGNIYNSISQYQRAIDFHEQSLEIKQELGDRQGEAVSLGNLGHIYFRLGEYQQAIDFHEQSLEIAHQIGDHQAEARALVNLGNPYLSLNEHQHAISFYRQSLAIAREIRDLDLEGIALANMGLTYGELEQHQLAIDYYRQQIDITREIGDRRREAIAIGNLGSALIDVDQVAEAETFLLQSIEIYESLRTGLSDAQLISIADTQARPYTNLERALIAQGKHTEALTVTERGRAQAFALQLTLRQTDTANDALVNYPSIADIQHIARDQNATLVTYSLIFDQALYIWVVQPSGDIQFRSVEFNEGDTSNINPIATIDGPVYRSNSDPSKLDTLVADSRTGIAVVGGIPDERLKDLHQVLIDPIADLLPTDPEANIVFVPQGSLFLVPFAALQDADGTYLIEKHTITTTPSMQVLGLAANEAADSIAQPASDALVVGNPVMPSIPDISLSPLPGAEAEAIEIGTLLNASPLLGNQATEAQIKQQMPTADLIHLATHGLLNYSDSPFDIPGALALTPGSGEDGLLTASEILDLELQAELAILSACDTGRGRITGDGVVGLSRSLITAGVPSVVVSLWAVPDAPTAKLMTEFYRQLSSGQTKAQALRQAMLKTLESHPEPRAWAAFTLVGIAD